MDLQEKYLQVQVQTATPEGLVTMLYDGLIRFLRQAKANLTSGRMQEANYFLIRAENIVAELNNSLDMSRQPVAESLRNLYEYMLRRMVEANVKKETALVDEVLGMAQQLRETWVEAVKQVSGTLRRTETLG
ncbi:MAG TPA: flagellar export chaperone FliS [Firmicutes bacterium]|nr:flagellar export chaperone FliS [Bacillota bacterium]